MRATTLLATAVVATALVIGAPRLPIAGGDAHAQEATPPPAAVPGPHRPIVDPPPAADPATPDRRRPRTPPVEASRPAPATTAPPAPTPPTVAPSQPAPVLEGGFRPGAAGEKAEGRAVTRSAANELRLEKLAVTPGRDLELWLVAVDRLGRGEDLTEVKHVSLGRLKKAAGDQTYRLPPEIDLRVYRNVVVWSRRERSARAYAPLAPQVVQRTVKQKKPRRG